MDTLDKFNFTQNLLEALPSDTTVTIKCEDNLMSIFVTSPSSLTKLINAKIKLTLFKQGMNATMVANYLNTKLNTDPADYCRTCRHCHECKPLLDYPMPRAAVCSACRAQLGDRNIKKSELS